EAIDADGALDGHLAIGEKHPAAASGQMLAHYRMASIEGEIHDLHASLERRRHTHAVRIAGVQDRGVPGRPGDHPLDSRHRLDGVDAIEAKVVRGDVEDDRNIASIETQPPLQDAATRGFEYGG